MKSLTARYMQSVILHIAKTINNKVEKYCMVPYLPLDYSQSMVGYMLLAVTCTPIYTSASELGRQTGQVVLHKFWIKQIRDILLYMSNR